MKQMLINEVVQGMLPYLDNRQIEELQKELKDYELIQKNAYTSLDTINGKIDDNNRNINLAVRKITELETKQQTMADFNINRPVVFCCL